MQDVFPNPISVQDLIQLYRGAESRAARLRLLIGAGRDLAMAERIETASEIVLRAAAEFGAYDAGCLMFVDPHGRGVRVAANLGRDFPNAGTWLSLAEVGDHAELCESALRRHLEASGSAESRRLLATGLMLPFGGGGAELGAMVLAAYGNVPTIDAEDRDTLQLLVSMLAGVASIARHRQEQARLNELLEQREARLAELVGRLISAQEDERRRLSIELHDGVAQLASSAHQYLLAYAQNLGIQDDEASALFQRSLGLLRRATAEIRAIMANLRPAVLDDFGIAMAIRKEVEEFDRECVRAGFLNGIADLRLHPDIETAFFRVFQEALRNVRKHARAERVEVEIVVEGATLFMRVRDDGCGFDTQPRGGARERGEQLGLLGMHERMRQVGGACRVESSPGGGTLVEAGIPLQMARTEQMHDPRT